MKRIRTPGLELIAGDVDSVSFLIDRLNEFLAGVIQKTSSDLLDVQMANAVSQVFLSLEKIWSAMPGFSLDKVKDLDPAEKFAVDFFHPLLDSDSLRGELESGSPSFAADWPFTQRMVQAYAPFFTRLEEILANRGFPQDQTNLVLGAVIGIVALCSFPLWVVYRHFHGYAAYDRVMPRLLNSLSSARFVLNDVRSTILGSAPSWQAADFDLVLSQLDASLRQALTYKANPYMKAFEENAETVFRPRIKLQEPDLNTQVESLQFWRHESGGKTSISLADKPPDPAADKLLPYLGGIYLNATDAVRARSFWALPDGWAALEQATRFVSQAGFWLYVNAANNPYGGRHPPHQTHSNGEDFDLGWTYLSTTRKIDENCVLGDPDQIIDPKNPRNQREVLARMQKTKPQLGFPIFSDPITNEDYTLVPISQGKYNPPTHAGIQKLAAHVVLQAVALSGLKRYLYADAQNMRYAATNLGLAMSYLARQLGVTDPKLDPWGSTKKAVIPVTEAITHYNHLHGELFARRTSDPSPLLKEPGLTSILTFLYELALERDSDKGFFDEMFRPRSGVEKDESEARIKPFRDAWEKRSSCGMPSLLPVWLTKERWHQFMGF